MPELPEVETVRAGLAAELIGAEVRSVDVHDDRLLKRHPGSASAFAAELIGKKIEAVVRRGKFLWLPLGGGRALVGHLGMSGQILLRTPGFEADRHNRVQVLFRTAAGTDVEMRFVDQRIFGGLLIDDLVQTPDGLPGGFSPEAAVMAQIPASAAHIARDLLDPAFDAQGVVRVLQERIAGIKALLLNQGILSGIGNIYADESLWRAKIHYDQPANSISTKALTGLISHATDVLAEAVARGGTSFDEQYKNVNGESGYFSQELNAYGQTDLPCARCQSPIRRDSWANRGSHYCPKCQRLR